MLWRRIGSLKLADIIFILLFTRYNISRGNFQMCKKENNGTLSRYLTRLRRVRLTGISALVYFVCCFVFEELALQLMVFGGFTLRTLYAVVFGAAAGMILWLISSLFGEKPGRIISIAGMFVVTLVFGVQYVYNSIFGNFMSLWQLGMGGQVLTNFYTQVLYGIWQAALALLVIIFPLVLTSVLLFKGVLVLPKISIKNGLAVILAFCILNAGSFLAMWMTDNDAYSVLNIYTGSSASVDTSVKSVGLIASMMREVRFMLFGGSSENEYIEIDAEDAIIVGGDSEYGYNVLDIDFQELASSTDDETLKRLDEYMADAQPTPHNQYTGMLKDYNLITICAESFSHYLIDKERTPALYELSTNGFIFENYYGTFGSVTTDGEYAMCMGIFPDTTRDKSQASFLASRNNALPFCLGNAFRSQGISTWAYHNYYGEYYGREYTHVNMGYDFKTPGRGLDIEVEWPSSDLDMMKASVDDYIDSGEQFHAYYMTFSGHYQYTWDNPMSAKNKDMADDLPYSETVQAYIAANQELELALEYLLDRLDEAGIADNTVIVLTNDHYPYGLTEEQYNELAGEEIDTVFERYHNSFICYVPDMEENVVVDEYCSTVDILPTLLNLFGLPYDSRLLMGQDVLSGVKNMAVLSDQSIITDSFRFDASTNTVTYTNGQEDEEYLAECQAKVQNMFMISTDILNSDYYRHVFPDFVQPEAPDIEECPFDDLSQLNGFYKPVIMALYDQGYVDPVSSTEFGLMMSCTPGEFVETLYRVDGKPDYSGDVRAFDNIAEDHKYYASVQWAYENGFLPYEGEELPMDRGVTRLEAAIILYNYAAYLGEDVSVDPVQIEEDMKDYPEFSREELTALRWSFQQRILRGDGTFESLMSMSHGSLERYYGLNLIYVFINRGSAAEG